MKVFQFELGLMYRDNRCYNRKDFRYDSELRPLVADFIILGTLFKIFNSQIDEKLFNIPVFKIAEWTGRRPVMHLS